MEQELLEQDPQKNPAYAPEGMKTHLDNLVISKIPEWDTWEQVQAGFERIRDDRFIEFSTHGLYSDFYEKNPDFPGYKRRITWTNSYSGCHWRAAMVYKHLSELGFPDSHKIFAFGDPIKTERGDQWWYHIANVVRLGAKVYVMDPVVDDKQPVELEKWIEALGGKNNISLAVCHGLTLSAGQYCYKKAPAKAWDFGMENQVDPEILEKNDTNKNLYDEWARLLEKGLNPDEVLK